MRAQTLTHIRLPRLIHYVEAAAVQDSLVRACLDAKHRDAKAVLRPMVLTMEMAPVYTTGRRDRGRTTDEEKRRLATPLYPSSPASGGQEGGQAVVVDVVESLRGGQTTFHGPGQLVAYPILDLSGAAAAAAAARNGLDLRPKCYVDRLEAALIHTCRAFGVETWRTQHTGVWAHPDRKVAAIGVHLRRNVSSHGVALNVNTDLAYFDRIVACGLADKRATSLAREGATSCTLAQVTDVFVQALADQLGFDGVDEERATDPGRLSVLR